MAQNIFQNFKTAATHSIVADSDSRGVYSQIVLARILINGGTSGTLTVNESDGGTTLISTIKVADDGAGNALPFSQEFGCVVADTLQIVATAATDITVIFERIR